MFLLAMNPTPREQISGDTLKVRCMLADFSLASAMLIGYGDTSTIPKEHACSLCADTPTDKVPRRFSTQEEATGVLVLRSPPGVVG